MNRLYKDQILAFVVFMKYFWTTYKNKKVTENMKIRQKIDFKWALSLFVQLYGPIYYQKIDNKDITNVIKLVKELV